MRIRPISVGTALAIANVSMSLSVPFVIAFGNWTHTHWGIVYPEGYMNTLRDGINLLVNVYVGAKSARDLEAHLTIDPRRGSMDPSHDPKDNQ